MNCDCSYTDGEYADLWHEEFPRAKKLHKCCECGDAIQPGQKYQKVRMMYDGRFDTYKTCMPCHRISKKYCPGGYLTEGLAELIEECLGFDYRVVPDDDDD